MNIPDNAMLAALEVSDRRRLGVLPTEVRELMEAAAPFIAAQALRDTGASLRNARDKRPFINELGYAIAEALECRANEVDPQ